MNRRPHRFHWVFATAAAWALVLVWAWHPEPLLKICPGSREDNARAGVNKLANSSYGLWREQHGTCPTLEQLVELGGAKKDPWGQPYRVRCYSIRFFGDGALVWSKGEDKIDGTGDDIKSWDLE